MRFYVIFRNFIRFSASFREFHILRVYPSFSEHSISDYRRLSPRFSDFTLFYAILCDFSQFYPILCEFSRVSHTAIIPELPRTQYFRLFPIIADYRRDSLILSHFMSGYFVFHLGHPFMLLFTLPHHSFLVIVALWYNARRSFSLSRTTLFYFRVLSRRYSAILADS